MNNILSIIEDIKWSSLKKVVSIRNLGTKRRGSGKSILNLETIIKLGPVPVIKNESEAYRRFYKLLGKNAYGIFPRTIYRKISPKQSLIAIEPVQGITFEQTVRGLIRGAYEYGQKSRSVEKIQKSIIRLSEEVLLKLRILHSGVNCTDPKKEMDLFLVEMSRGLSYSLKRSKIKSNFSAILRVGSDFMGTVSLAHRDLSLINIIVVNDSVTFIDPRHHVASSTQNQRGARFASPVIDLVAFNVALQRSEVEVQNIFPNLRLSARDYIEKEISYLLRQGVFSPAMVALSEAVVWAGYAACRCSNCLNSKNKFLRDFVFSKTKNCLDVLCALK
ncbi:MAG: hypothetical protein COV70_02460 [Parcubacteria group bacterium CG11_big_fil_rev_8_21_14_0_20_39_22]|nr:MAG: hypothetical protein COV70_02460 [Parcubacteria group bacterium CG11_big_fil_rev_8_21_14_0_20_39_22]